MQDFQFFELHNKHTELLNRILGKVDELQRSIMATNTGLTALQQAVTDETSAVAAAVAEIQSLATQLAGLTANSEDPAVAALAAQLETQVAALNAAVAAATAPAAPVATPEVKK